MDVLGGLADGLSGLRIGVVEEGFDDADVEVRDLVLAAVDVLARAGAQVTKVRIPEHHQVGAAQRALTTEGALAVFNTGFYGAFARTYYPASVIAAIDELWASHADVLTPRSKLSLIAAAISRRNYNGRVYAKAQNVRPTFIKAYDSALADVDVLVMPTCLMTAPKNQQPDSYLQALEDNLSMRSSAAARNTQPFNYTGHPALAVPVGKSTSGLPASMQLIGRFFDDPLLLRVAYAYEHSVNWDRVIGTVTLEPEPVLA
jgi:amidase